MVLVGASFPDAKAQVAAEVTCEPRTLLKPLGFGCGTKRPTPAGRALTLKCQLVRQAVQQRGRTTADVYHRRQLLRAAKIVWFSYAPVVRIEGSTADDLDLYWV
jgi:hypothetical protein